MMFQNHRYASVSGFRVKIAASAPLKRVSSKVIELVSNFIEKKGSKKDNSISQQKAIKKL